LGEEGVEVLVPGAVVEVHEQGGAGLAGGDDVLQGGEVDALVAAESVDGVEALETLRANRCDLIISDVDMPRMNGFDLTSKVKHDERLRDLPVILVTALDSAADRERGLESGADAYIVKHEFDQKTLLETIEQLI